MSIIQEAINILYRHPKGKIRQIQRQGGIWNTWQINRARKEMERAAQTLRVPFGDTGNATLEVHFLTGKKYWYQTVFCMYSLQKWASRPIRYHLYDDSSFDESFILQVQQQAPSSIIHTNKAVEERLEKAIPQKDFPFLWHKRKVYPHIKKLTDIHAGTTGWKIVLDSDMLFWNRPFSLESWSLNPENPFFIEDIITAYGYSQELMYSLAGVPIREKINVGIVGLKSDDINWENLERWGQKLEQKEGTSYFLEQALTAMVIGQHPANVGYRKDGYIVMPNKEEVITQKGILHHYVDTSKEWYFKKAWKNFANE